MKRMILIAFIVISHSCFAQGSSDGYNLTLNFAPSFIHSCKLVIQKSKDRNYIKLTVKDSLKSYTRDDVFITNKDLTPLTTFLKTYKFRIKNNIDTTGSQRIFENGDSVTVYSVNAGLDGIDVVGELDQGIAHRFAFWSPKKGTENANLMNIIFELLEKSYANDVDIEYIESLKNYFPHGLTVRKISAIPLKYKWYGDVNEDQEDDLNKFLNALPKHHPVYIDVSLFTIAPIIDDDLAQNKNIYWVNPSKYVLRALKDADISKRHILFIKK